MQFLIGFIFSIFWLMGIVLAKGFWVTLATITCPCFAWYLVVEHTMSKFGFLCL
jgi:hypothetical protein